MHAPPASLNSSAVIPPLLACLPTAFASPRPPPALLELLSPILKQRVQLLCDSPGTKSWLPLLNWDDEEASQLTKIIESASFEPHPVSGEIELDAEPDAPKYRRIDEETLQGLINLPDVELAVVYVWATAGEAPGWTVSELKPLHAGWQRNPTPWSDSIRLAEDAFESKTHGPAITTQLNSDTSLDEAEDEDDGYWDRYDATPGRTPKRSPAPNARQQYGGGASLRPGASGVEDNYWNQYGSVQPALDADDPDEKQDDEQAGESTLNGSTILNSSASHPASSADRVIAQRSMFTPNGAQNESPEAGVPRPMFTPNGTTAAEGALALGLQAFLGNHVSAVSQEEHSLENIAQPRPRSRSANSSSSGKSALVEQLEGQVESQASQDGRKNSVVAEFAIQQHISTSLKSLFRLAKGAGIQRNEFERIVQNELGVLGILDEE